MDPKAATNTCPAVQRAQRKQEAAATEAALVAHFGPEARNCATWPDLYQRGWLNELTNSSAAGVPKGLPTDANGRFLGGGLEEEGLRAYAHPPSIYSDTFLYFLALQLADGAAAAQQQVSVWLPNGDTLDCAELSVRLTQLEDILHLDKLHYLSCTGCAVPLSISPVQEAHFLHMLTYPTTSEGILLGRAVVFIPGKEKLRTKEALRVLDAIKQALQVYRIDTRNSAQPITRPVPNDPDSSFAPLLINYQLDALTALLIDLGLIDADTKQATPVATPGAWVGVVYGLLEVQPPRLRSSLAATGRALREEYGAKVSESALQNGISKRGSESEKVRDKVLALLAGCAVGD